ncbi:MAG TPA: hypothetical protein VJ505_07155 [Holophagaceae bacterium]|nr:hypothetical protein [Holophagaceae bacterium]
MERRLASLLLLTVLGAHALVKVQLDTVPELLWACNVSSLILVAALWCDWAPGMGLALVWHLCVGEPGWIAGIAARGWAFPGWTSVAVHTLPATFAFLTLRGRGLPRGSAFLALGMFVALVPPSHYLTPTSLNVNLAHQRLGFLTSHFQGNWDYRLAFCAGLLGLLLLGQALLRRALPEGRSAA